MQVVDLDHDLSLDRGRVGEKAAMLAMARRAGFPVLPGFVVEADSSRESMAVGANAFGTRGSGAARLAVLSQPVPGADDIVRAGQELADVVVARSSTEFEAGGWWAGAFSSLVDLDPKLLPKAIASVWASAFSVDALERQKAAGIEPGSFGVAVLVQRSLAATVGGVAEASGDGSVVVTAIDGSPAPLLQGWARGETVRRNSNGVWEHELSLERFGTSLFDEVADMTIELGRSLGANRCEWALDRSVRLLQIGSVPTPLASMPARRKLVPEEMIQIVRAAMTAPGRLGWELVLPWGVGGLPVAVQPLSIAPDPDPLARALELGRQLTAEVWRLPEVEAASRAHGFLRRIAGFGSGAAIAGQIRQLGTPSPSKVGALMTYVVEVGQRLADKGSIPSPDFVWYLSPNQIEATLAGEQLSFPARIGTGPLDLVVAETVLTYGELTRGTSSSGGVGVGLRFEASCDAILLPRSVVTASDAVPALSQLIWDASGLVTHGGSPAAHVFESARSLGVPAVCGVELTTQESPMVIAVDGNGGEVALISLEGMA